MSNSVFILRRICEVDAFVAASIITELKAIEGIIDFGAEIFDSYTSDWLQQMLTSTVSAAMTPQPIAAVDAIDETTFILSSNNSPQNSFLSREEVVQSQLWTSPPGTGCSCREDNPLVELTCASPLARSSNLASAIISSSALEEWIDQDTQAFFPESPEIDNGARSDDYNCRRMLNSEDCAAVFDAEVIALAVEEDVDSVALKDENRDLKDQLSQQQAIVSSLIVKLSKFEEAATNATADAARLRGDLAAMMVSRDSAVDASNRQKLIIEESWQKLSILAKRIETTEEDAKMARAQCAVAVEHSTLVEHRLLLSEATAAEAKSLADGTLTRVSEIISENRRLIDSKRKLENSLREMNLKFSECKVEQQRSEVLLEAKSSKIEDLLEKVSHLVKDQTELTNTNKCLEFDLLTAQNTVEELIGQVASKESRILALEEDLRRERVQLEQGKQTISAKEQQLSEHLEKLNVANNKLAVSMALVDETNNRLAASLVRAEEKEAELVMARADISKHKEIIMYINKLSAESSAAK